LRNGRLPNDRYVAVGSNDRYVLVAKPKGNKTMKNNPQRPLNSAIDPRNGAPKRLADTAITPGHKRQTAPSHEFLHGAPVDDLPLQKSYERETPIHPNTPSRADRGQHTPGEGSRILDEAARLGRPAAITSGGSAPGANGPAVTKA
jgi:hypothetical protein